MLRWAARSLLLPGGRDRGGLAGLPPTPGLMRCLVQVCLLILWFAALTPAQLVPGRYVVELQGFPLGADVRTKDKAALAARRAAVRAEQARLRRRIQENHGTVVASVENLMNALLVSFPDQNVATLAALPGVKTVYPVHQSTLMLDHALPLHRVPEAWAPLGGQDQAGAGVKIAVLDSGISPDHPAFQDPALAPPPGYPQASKPANLALTNNKIIVARSYEDIYQQTEPDDARDRGGHGTAVAMCAAGVTNTGPWATITGVAPKAWIGVYKVFPGNTNRGNNDVIVKALDDALADGMDVINLSLGSLFVDPLLDRAVDRLSQYGVIVVAAAGNSGPGLNTIIDPGWLASVITVGATQNDRFFGGTVTLPGATYPAFPSSGPVPGPITSTVFDVSTVDPTSLLCSPLPAGVAAGQIALILRGSCSFEAKVNHAEAGGAIAVMLYNNVAGGVTPNIGTALLPTVLLTQANGLALKAAIADQPAMQITVTFDGAATPQDYRSLASFSSKGPNFDYTIKPDLAAVGTDVYMAAQSLDSAGGMYNQSGYGVSQGTSFSAPLVAGAVAVLRAARPDLTAGQYRSLIINSASPLIHEDETVERVQRAGAGIMNLDAALRSNIASFPTSLTYGTGNGNLGGYATSDVRQLTLTNSSTTTDTFHVSAIPFDYAPPLEFSDILSDGNPAGTWDVTLQPGQSKTVYAFWIAKGLVAGEYQGYISVQSSCCAALIPYWYGVPTGFPADQSYLMTPPEQAPAGSTQTAYVRVIDSIGYAIVDPVGLGFQGVSTTPGASVTLIPLPPEAGNMWEIDFQLAPQMGTNSFTVSFAGLPPTKFTITGTGPHRTRPPFRPLDIPGIRERMVSHR